MPTLRVEEHLPENTACQKIEKKVINIAPVPFIYDWLVRRSSCIDEYLFLRRECSLQCGELYSLHSNAALKCVIGQV